MLKKSDCMTVKEMKELLQDLPDDMVLLIMSDVVTDQAVAFKPYPVTTNLDEQAYLFQTDYTDSVPCHDC